MCATWLTRHDSDLSRFRCTLGRRPAERDRQHAGWDDNRGRVAVDNRLGITLTPTSGFEVRKIPELRQLRRRMREAERTGAGRGVA